jgi:hypothetical protein
MRRCAAGGVSKRPASGHLERAVKVPTWVLAAVVGLAAGAVYLPSLWGEFVLDDVPQIVIDDYIHRPSHLWDVLTFRVMTRDVFDWNRPMNLLSLMVDSMLWGRRPAGYHLTNVLLHAGCAVLLLLVFRDVLQRLGARGPRPGWPVLGATVGGLLFAVHPANSEAVSAVHFRGDLLATLAILAALWLAGHFPARRRWAGIALIGGCALATVLAAGSKENGTMIVPMLLAYRLVVRRGERWRPWAVLIAASAAVAVSFLVARFELGPENSVIFPPKPTYLGGSFTEMLTIQPRIWLFQLAEIAWPGLLCADQSLHFCRYVDLPLALVSLAVASIVALALAWKNRAVGLGAVWFGLGLLPVSNLVPIWEPLADRYLYLPMVGVALAAGAIVSRVGPPARPWARAAAGAVAIGVFGLWAFLSVQRAVVWQHSVSLWKDTVARNAWSVGGLNNLGFAYYQQGSYAEAADAFNRAVRLWPREADAWAGLAITYEALHRPQEAADALRTSVACDPKYAHPSRLVKALTWLPADAETLQRLVERVFGPAADGAKGHSGAAGQ